MATATTPNSTPAEPEKKSVNVPLLAHVHDYFAKKAKADDHTLNSFLARLLHTHHAQEVAAQQVGTPNLASAPATDKSQDVD